MSASWVNSPHGIPGRRSASKRSSPHTPATFPSAIACPGISISPGASQRPISTRPSEALQSLRVGGPPFCPRTEYRRPDLHSEGGRRNLRHRAVRGISRSDDPFRSRGQHHGDHDHDRLHDRRHRPRYRRHNDGYRRFLPTAFPLFEPFGVTIEGHKTLIRGLRTKSIGVGGDSVVRSSGGKALDRTGAGRSSRRIRRAVSDADGCHDRPRVDRNRRSKPGRRIPPSHCRLSATVQSLRQPGRSSGKPA